MRAVLTWVFWVLAGSVVVYGLGLVYAWRVGVI